LAPGKNTIAHIGILSTLDAACGQIGHPADLALLDELTGNLRKYRIAIASDCYTMIG
jgi:hypothetical protein